MNQLNFLLLFHINILRLEASRLEMKSISGVRIDFDTNGHESCTLEMISNYHRIKHDLNTNFIYSQLIKYKYRAFSSTRQ